MEKEFTVPIFPLSSVVMVRADLLPLHIFEPQYHKLVAHLIERDRVMAMAMPERGPYSFDQPVLPIAGLGKIVQHMPLPDGRANIVLKGLGRIRIIEEIETPHPWREVRAVPFPDEHGLMDSLPEIFADVLVAKLELHPDAALQYARRAPAEVADLVLTRLDLQNREKYRILCMPKVGDRIDAIAQILNEASGRTAPDEMGPEDPRRN